MHQPPEHQQYPAMDYPPQEYPGPRTPYPPNQPPTGPPAPRRKRSPAWLVALAVGIVAVCGIGTIVAIAANRDAPAAPAAGEQAEPPWWETNVEPAEYGSVADLRDAVEAAGHQCGSYEPIDDPDSALERAHCTSSITLAIHSDERQATDSVAAINAVYDAIGGVTVHLIGPNWTVGCSDLEALCRELRAELGGKLDVHEVAKPEPEPAPEPELTGAQEQAVGAAEDYLAFSGFSRKGLIEQLEYEGFATKDAKFAVDYLDVNWKQQAVIVAKDYLDYSHFSRQGLIEQLEFEGFTRKQAEYGVEQAGL